MLAENRSFRYFKCNKTHIFHLKSIYFQLKHVQYTQSKSIVFWTITLILRVYKVKYAKCVMFSVVPLGVWLVPALLCGVWLVPALLCGVYPPYMIYCSEQIIWRSARSTRSPRIGISGIPSDWSPRCIFVEQLSDRSASRPRPVT